MSWQALVQFQAASNHAPTLTLGAPFIQDARVRFHFRSYMKRLYFFFLALPIMLDPARAVAQERNELRHLPQEQRIEQHSAERERMLLQGAESQLEGDKPILIIDGQPYAVEKTVPGLGQALYLSLQHRQWAAAQALLSQYLELPDRDPLLVHYAQGVLARTNGHLVRAEDEFRALLRLQSGFLPGRLELARVLFESAQEPEARRAFSEIHAYLENAGPGAAGVRKTIDFYLQALDHRQAWTGAVSLGWRWSDNINRSSASRTCLIRGGPGICFIERALPPQIKASGPELEASLQRRVPLAGHHALYARLQAYGSWNRNHSDYNDASVSALAGYSYRDAGRQITVAPEYTLYTWGGRTLYETWGLSASWRYSPASHSLVKLDADYKLMRYRQQAYARHFDGPVRSLSGTYFRSVGAGWTLFGGLDVESSQARADVQRYLLYGARLGASVAANGFTSSAVVSTRQRRHGAYSPLLEARRRDNEQTYTLLLAANRWTLAGFTPSLTLRHSKVRSNVGWLHSYDRNEIGLKMEHVI